EVRAEVAAGHAVGNHTWDHPQAVRGSAPYGFFDHLPRAVQAAQVDRTTRAIIQATGVAPCFFRAPGGHGTASVALVAARGLSTIGWSRSSGDSGQPATTTRAAVRRLVAAATAHPGPHV